MINILSRARCFVAIIAVGFLLRRSGFFKREDFTLLSRIVINITLLGEARRHHRVGFITVFPGTR